MSEADADFDAYARKAFGGRVRALRLTSEMSQIDLAKVLRLNRVAVQSLEDGNRRVYLDELFKLVALFDVAIEDLCHEWYNKGQKAGRPVRSDLKSKKQTDLELAIAAELSRLNPAGFDRIIRLAHTLSVTRRAAKERPASVEAVLEGILEQTSSIDPLNP